MFKSLYKKFKREKIAFQPDRKFHHNYFKDPSLQAKINNKGFAVIKSCIAEEDIRFLEETYHQLIQFPEYSIEDKFQNSGRFRSPEIRNYVMDRIEQFSKNFLPTLLDQNVFDENTTGAFQIKPPSKVSELNPHQDAPVIDETNDNGLFVWIPFCDTNKDNGAISVLPGSHLWNNHQRSLNVKWVFEKHIKTLWNYMEPVYLNRGDIVCWDTALIHASTPNVTNETRVAITTTILPKNFKMVEYHKDGTTDQGMVEKYQVERSFWETEDIMKRPPCPPNKFLGLEKLVLDNIAKSQLVDLIKDTQLYLND